MYLIDSNILIYHFNNNIPNESQNEINRIFKKHFNISVISKMEFLGFGKFTKKELKKAKLFLDYAHILELDNEIVDLVIDMKQKHSIKLADAIIACVAVKYNFTLVTRNVEDFKAVEIKIYNPFEIK